MFCESMKGRGRQRWRTFFQYAHVTLSLTAASCWRVGKGRFRIDALGRITTAMAPDSCWRRFPCVAGAVRRPDQHHRAGIDFAFLGPGTVLVRTSRHAHSRIMSCRRNRRDGEMFLIRWRDVPNPMDAARSRPLT
jgi:hypothetical protein